MLITELNREGAMGMECFLWAWELKKCVMGKRMGEGSDKRKVKVWSEQKNKVVGVMGQHTGSW